MIRESHAGPHPAQYLRATAVRQDYIFLVRGWFLIWECACLTSEGGLFNVGKFKHGHFLTGHLLAIYLLAIYWPFPYWPFTGHLLTGHLLAIDLLAIYWPFTYWPFTGHLLTGQFHSCSSQRIRSSAVFQSADPCSSRVPASGSVFQPCSTCVPLIFQPVKPCSSRLPISKSLFQPYTCASRVPAVFRLACESDRSACGPAPVASLRRCVQQCD